MKLVVKRLGCGQVENVINMAANRTIGELKDAVGALLNLPTNALKLICSGRVLSSTTATLRFYGIEEGAVLTVVFTPNIDMHSNLVRAVRDILGPSYPTAAIPAIIVHFKYFLAKSVEDDLSLDELEKYAKIRNMTRSPLVTKDPNM